MVFTRYTTTSRAEHRKIIMNKDIRNFLIYTMMVLVIFVAYFIYAYTVYAPIPEKETGKGDGGIKF